MRIHLPGVGVYQMEANDVGYFRIRRKSVPLSSLQNGSWTSFVDDVKRCFRRSPETAEARCRDHFANPFFA
jgi:hypothetical protein